MKILVAEDDPHILEGLEELLEEEGWSVLTAPDGQAALEAWKEKKPDAVILDIMMPRMNGYDVCRAIRAEDQALPILFLSAKSEEVDKVLGLELGADDFVSKPFGTRELMARVRAMTRRALASKKTENKGDFQAGDLVVKAGELRAYRGERAIDLGPRDVAVLRLLAQKTGEAVSREELFDRCWGLDYAGTSRTLDQHISQLRKRVEIDPRDPQLIRTVHGVGYRIDS